MGRYINGDFNHKFWFGTQPSSDVCEFFGEDTVLTETNDDGDTWEIYSHSWKNGELDMISAKVTRLKKEFKETYELTYSAFMDDVDKRGYTASSDDAETDTALWEEKCGAAAKIQLGAKIRDTLRRTNADNIEVEYEC